MVGGYPDDPMGRVTYQGTAGIPDKRKLREGDVEETGGESKKISSSKPGKTTSKAPKTPGEGNAPRNDWVKDRHANMTSVLAADSEDNSPAESKTQLTMDALTKAKAELQTRKRELERVNEEIRAQTEKIEAEIKEHFASSPGYQREIMDRALSQLSVKIVVSGGHPAHLYHPSQEADQTVGRFC